MLRQMTSRAVLVATILSAGNAWGQTAAPPRVGAQPSLGNAGLRPNTFEANKPVAMTNKIIKPVPLSAESQRSALTNIDKQVASQIEGLSEKLKAILPDELTILTKTNGWKTEAQQALVQALRDGDRTAVYEAWVKGNPQDTAGAELAARQTDVSRLMTRLAQDAEKNKAALKQNVAELDAALSKIASSTPAVADLSAPMKTLKMWVEARKLIESSTPGKGPIAKLPTGGDVTLISDPTLPLGTAIVLSDKAMLIGHEGQNRLAIATGNAAEALGLPIVTGTPIDDAEGDQATNGVLIVNPASSRGTINYNINGNHYVAQPGMQQKLAALPAGGAWTIEYDKGDKFGPATFTLAPGTYYFTPSDKGWQLYRHRFEITLDNSQSNQEFNFIFQSQDMTVPAGGTRTLSSNYPIVVKFDRGNGSEFVAKSAPLTIGNLQVGVNANDNLWDLFPTNDNRREVLKLKPFNADSRATPK
jgi:flagellar biosynthesis/type III secretory pathway chaperone